MRARPRHAALRLVGTVLAAVVTCGAAVGVGETTATAATAHGVAAPVRSHAPHGPLRPASGVTVWRQRFTTAAGHESRAVLMRVDLRTASGLHVAPAISQEAIGGPRRTVAAQADVTGAVAGVNGDWFDMSAPAAVPRGAVIRSGHVLKTARPGWRANLTIAADGTAAIGPIRFHGAVRAGGSHMLIASINTPWDAAHGHLTYLTHAMLRLRLGRTCTVAYGRGGEGHRVITALDARALTPPRVAAGRWAIASCGGPGARWLKAHLRPGVAPSVVVAFPDGTPTAAVSGGRVLVRNGAPFVDVGGQRLWGANPETFVCVSRSGRSLLLGAIDGRSDLSWGVTQPQLTQYMLQLHCWDGMTLDGGGSTTMVARLPSTTGQPAGVTVLNHPSDGRPRRIADGLYVYTDGAATRSQ